MQPEVEVSDAQDVHMHMHVALCRASSPPPERSQTALHTHEAHLVCTQPSALAPLSLAPQMWMPAGLGAENITTGDADQISSAYDDVVLGPIFAATDSFSQSGAVYYR